MYFRYLKYLTTPHKDLYKALWAADPDAVQKFFDLRKDQNKENVFNSNLISPAQIVVHHPNCTKSSAILEKLVRYGEDINKPDDNGNTIADKCVFKIFAEIGRASVITAEEEDEDNEIAVLDGFAFVNTGLYHVTSFLQKYQDSIAVHIHHPGQRL